MIGVCAGESPMRTYLDPCRARTLMSIEAPATPTILLVDDESAVRAVVGVALRGAGYRVIEAASSDEAWRQFRKHRRDIGGVVCDILMPGTHGPALAQGLIDERPDLGVLLMSGHVTPAPSILRLNHRHGAFLAK